MNRTPTPIGVRSFMGELEQMDDLPRLPDSAVVIREGEDVFITFHFECDYVAEARALSAKMTNWLRKELKAMGADMTEVDPRDYDV